MVEERPAPEAGGGLRRWIRLAKTLGDCQAVLISGIGETPHEILAKSGLKPLTMNGFIEEGLQRIFEGKDLSVLQARKESCSQCSGQGSSCL
jgi:nitrogen fixation protein NifB